MILENTFTSIPNIVRGWPIIGFLSFVCTQRWNSASKISKIDPSIPIMFCSGKKDTLVPRTHMINLWLIAQERGNIPQKGHKSDRRRKFISMTGRFSHVLRSGAISSINVGVMKDSSKDDTCTNFGGNLFVSYPQGGHGAFVLL